jgi:hypothetical protein
MPGDVSAANGSACRGNQNRAGAIEHGVKSW